MTDPVLPDDEAFRTRLAVCDAVLTPGLSEGETAHVEARFGFRFPPDYRRLLALALPLGDPRWPD